MKDLAERSVETEIMDDLNCSGEVLHQTLRELEIINSWLGGNAVTLRALSNLMRGRSRDETYTIADLGCGGGDMAKHIVALARKKGYDIHVRGIDANPHVIEYATKNFRDAAASFEQANIMSPEFQMRKFDVVIGTLFFHHFSRVELVKLFRQFKDQTRIGFIINDIHRHYLALHSIRILTQLFSKSDMVKNDAPLSVRRAFTRDELISILSEAGLTNYSIRWRWAFRWEVVVRTQA